MHRSSSHSDRHGFTLIELLVVITIIGIMAGLLLPAVFGAIRTARINAISMEITQLAQAIEAYKSKRHDYPPDFSNEAAVSAHFLKAYSRSTFQVVPWLRTTNVSPPPATLDPAEALVFWLKTVREDPRNPILGTGATIDLYEFDPARLVDLDQDGWPEYLPRYTKTAPYVYFDGRVQPTPQGVSTCAYFYAVFPPQFSPYSGASPSVLRPVGLLRTGNPPDPDPALFGFVRPYRSNVAVTSPASDATWPNTDPNPTSWINVGKFQIIAPGMDSEFGFDNVDPNTSGIAFKQFPRPNYYLQPGVDQRPDQDNLTSFSEGKTLEDAKP